jgi:hypothetical protein
MSHGSMCISPEAWEGWSSASWSHTVPEEVPEREEKELTLAVAVAVVVVAVVLASVVADVVLETSTRMAMPTASPRDKDNASSRTDSMVRESRGLDCSLI